jgi:hypothetical protein
MYLPKQKPLEQYFLMNPGQNRPHIKRKHYSCVWKIKDTKLWLLSATTPVGAGLVNDTLARFLPGRSAPIVADWFSGIILATYECFDDADKYGLNEVSSIRFDIDNGHVYSTERFKEFAEVNSYGIFRGCD